MNEAVFPTLEYERCKMFFNELSWKSIILEWPLHVPAEDSEVCNNRLPLPAAAAAILISQHSTHSFANEGGTEARSSEGGRGSNCGLIFHCKDYQHFYFSLNAAHFSFISPVASHFETDIQLMITIVLKFRGHF